MKKTRKDEKTIAIMTLLIFLYFFLIQQYPFVFSLICSFTYLSMAWIMKGTTMLIDQIMEKKNDSNESN